MDINEKTEKIELLTDLVLTLNKTPKYHFALERVCPEFEEFSCRVNGLAGKIFELSDEELETIEQEGVDLIYRLINFKVEPFIKLEQGFLYELYRESMQKLMNNGYVRSYEIKDTGTGAYELVYSTTEDAVRIKNVVSRSLLRRYIRAYMMAEKDFDAGRKALQEISKEGFVRAGYALSFLGLHYAQNKDDIMTVFQTAIETIKSGVVDAYYVLLLLDEKIEDFGLSNKDKEIMLKILTFSDRKETSAITKKWLAKLYANGYIGEEKFAVSTTIDYTKASYYAESLLEDKRFISIRLEMIGILLEAKASTLDDSDVAPKLLAMAINEAKNSKAFSNICKVPADVNLHFLPLLEDIAKDESIPQRDRNKARYELAKRLDAMAHKGVNSTEVRGLLLEAANNGCWDSQDVLYSYAGGKKGEAALLQIIAPLIASRESIVQN